MQKSLYDSSCLIWSPQGRLYQVEYAMEAVNQGTCLLGLRSKDSAVICGLRSTMHEKLGFHQEKIFSAYNHIGLGISGLTPDGRLLHKYLKNECLNYSYVYDSNHPVERLVTKIAEKAQKKTQGGDSKRPYGVGALIVGCDSTGPRLFRTCPSGFYYEYICYAIGSRCQTANTYLENNMNIFDKCNNEELLLHALKAMKKCQDIELTCKNIDLGIVSKNNQFKKLSEEEIAKLLEKVGNLGNNNNNNNTNNNGIDIEL